MRSNIFQRLVAEVHKELAPGWSVTESRELIDSVTGDKREVDVVAEALVAGYRLFLCIEVRDRGRPADVTWLEGVAKKHEHLPTNKLVVWSAIGFTKACVMKAKALGIDTLSPGSLGDAPWATLARALVGGSLKWVRPHLSPSADVVVADGPYERWTCQPETLLRQADGDQQILVGAILDQIVWSPQIRTVLLDHAPEGSGDFFAVYEPPFACNIEGAMGSVGRLSRLLIGIKTECEIAPLVVKSAHHGRTVTSLAEATLSDGTLQLVTREVEAAPPAVSGVYKKLPIPAGTPRPRRKR